MSNSSDTRSVSSPRRYGAAEGDQTSRLPLEPVVLRAIQAPQMAINLPDSCGIREARELLASILKSRPEYRSHIADCIER